MVAIEDFLQQQAAKIGLALDKNQVSKFVIYYNLLVAGNKKFNLTTICEPEEAVLKHFVDSLLCATLGLICGREKVIDVGSGAGLPGIPLKIFYPDIAMVLLEATQKKAMFLENAVKTLELAGVEVINDRAETAGQDAKRRERFDFAVSRAVAGVPVLLEYCLPLVRPGGYFLALTGPSVDRKEKMVSNVAPVLGGELSAVHDFELPCGKGKRKILVYKKVGICAGKYPRRPGIPAKRPLG